MKRNLDLNRLLGVRETDWPPELQARMTLLKFLKPDMVGVTDGARQLASFEMSDLNTGVVKMSEVRKRLAPDFVVMFQSLLDVMSIQESKQRAKEATQLDASQASSTLTVIGKRPRSQESTNPPTKRMKPSYASPPSPRPEPTTPDQPTHPADPDFTGGSIESKDEENTKMLLNHFLMNAMTVLDSEFLELPWQRSGHTVEITHT